MNLYRVGSFNLYKFSSYSNKDVDTICKIIYKNEIDILAIQEIFSEEALNQLLRCLGTNWDGRWATPNSRSVSAAEGYAFIWNKQRVDLSRRRSGACFEPVIHNQYSHKDGNELIRNPFYGRFILKANEMVEIRLINTHIMFSLNREENDSEEYDSNVGRVGAVKMRKRELDILATKILPKLDDKVYDYQWNEIDDICRKPYTILLGDYNLNLKESGAKDTFIDESLIVLKDANSVKKIITVQKDLTTLQSKSEESGIIEGYRNNFDHFTYDQNRPIETKCWAVDIPNNRSYFNGNYDEYKKKISDHLMIIMELKFV